MKHALIYSVLILTAAAAGLSLRLPQLHHRPLHTDEAVHAVKFGELLEDNKYVYDKFEYHGPTLNYFTLIPARLLSQETLKGVDEFTLRIVPVFFGFCIVLLPLMLVKGLGKFTAIMAGGLTAVSPAMVFYSRYYIQETLLVCFTLAMIVCAFRFCQSKKIVWIIPAGVFAGLMGATKETFVIALAAMIVSMAITVFMTFEKGGRLTAVRSLSSPNNVLLFLLSAVLVSVLFFSSFFTNPQGIIDSAATYATYFNRAHANTRHIHPWYYYLKLLLYSKASYGPLWTEGFIVVMAAVGFVLALIKKTFTNENKSLLRFIAFYTLIMTLLYSLIPYKTPWCLLGFLSGMIILAAYAVSAIITSIKNMPLRAVVILLFAGATAHLGFMSYLSITKYAASPANPYVYAHTSADVYEAAERIKETVAAADTGNDTVIQIVCPENDYWPLPWYLRSLNNIGYWNGVDEKMPASPMVITAATSHDGRINALEKRVINHLYNVQPKGQVNLYVPLFDEYLEIRPHVEIRGYITKELSDQANKQVDPLKSD